MEHYLNQEIIDAYGAELTAEEKSEATIEKYVRDLKRFAEYAGKDGAITKDCVIAYKQFIKTQYAATTVNGILASLNGFFKKMEWYDCVVKSLRIQRDAFRARERELGKDEYYKLVRMAKERRDERMYYLMQTICSTGIRVSELKFVTVEALKERRVEVALKGKNRVVLLPSALCKELKHYAKQNHVKSGSVFVTRSGKPMDRSNIFRAMKMLGKAAGVSLDKVFPHNLRHLFACTYYKAEKDIAHLADILGHSSIETTRIYLTTSYEEQVKRIERLALIV